MWGLLVFLVLVSGCREEGPAQNNGRSRARLGQLWGEGLPGRTASARAGPSRAVIWLCLLLPF